MAMSLPVVPSGSPGAIPAYCPDVSAVHAVRDAETARHFRLLRSRNTSLAAAGVLAWSGDRSPIRGCTTSEGVQVLGHVKTP